MITLLLAFSIPKHNYVIINKVVLSVSYCSELNLESCVLTVDHWPYPSPGKMDHFVGSFTFLTFDTCNLIQVYLLFELI